MNTSVKMIKFDLNLKGIKVTNLEQLQDNFCAEILPIFKSGRLAKWFKSRDLLEQAAATESICKDGSHLEQLKAICQVLGLDDDDDVLQLLLDDHTSNVVKVTSAMPSLETEFLDELKIQKEATGKAEAEVKKLTELLGMKNTFDEGIAESMNAVKEGNMKFAPNPFDALQFILATRGQDALENEIKELKK